LSDLPGLPALCRFFSGLGLFQLFDFLFQGFDARQQAGDRTIGDVPGLFLYFR